MIVRFLFTFALLAGPAGAQGWVDPRPGPVLSSSDAPAALLVGEEIRLGPDVLARMGVHSAYGDRYLTIYLHDDEADGAFASVGYGRMQNRIGLYVADVNDDGYAEILIEDMWEDVSDWSILASEPAGEGSAIRRWRISHLGREDDAATPGPIAAETSAGDGGTAIIYGDRYVDAARGWDHRPCWLWRRGLPVGEPTRSLNACNGSGVTAVPVEQYHAYSVD